MVLTGWGLKAVLNLMQKIYILKKQKLIKGPYSLEKIREKGVKYSDMVWYEGLADWTPVDKIEAFENYIYEAKQIPSSFIDRVFSFLK